MNNDRYDEMIISLLNKRYIDSENKANSSIESRIRKGFKYIIRDGLPEAAKRTARFAKHPEARRDMRREEWLRHIDRCLSMSTNRRDTIQNATATVYCCITGGYDKPPLPPVHSQHTRYKLFTDCIEGEIDGWEIVPIPKKIAGYDARTINRYIKMHPHEIVEDDFSIYVDGNLWLLTDVWEMCSTAQNSRAGVAMFAHGLRDCVYDEAAICKAYKRGNSLGIDRQIKSCMNAGVPKHGGLLEACLIVTDLHSTVSKDLFEKWWSEFISNGGERDQIALPAAVYSAGLTMKDFGILGRNVRADPRIHSITHRTDIQ